MCSTSLDDDLEFNRGVSSEGFQAGIFNRSIHFDPRSLTAASAEQILSRGKPAKRVTSAKEGGEDSEMTVDEGPAYKEGECLISGAPPYPMLSSLAACFFL